MTRLEYRVPYADTDQMGVVYYANYFVYFERVRNELLRSRGFPYSRMEEEGIGLPVLESHCQHRSPARYDDLLTLTGEFQILTPARVKASCCVWRDSTELARGHTVHAVIDLASGRPKRMPESMIQWFSED